MLNTTIDIVDSYAFAQLRNEFMNKKFHVDAETTPKYFYLDPATIVFWSDKTKTLVKCSDQEVYDPEKGLTMCIAKKMLGNKGNYYNEIRKWLKNA